MALPITGCVDNGRLHAVARKSSTVYMYLDGSLHKNQTFKQTEQKKEEKKISRKAFRSLHLSDLSKLEDL